MPTLPHASKFHSSILPDGTYKGTFGCVEGYHMLGNPNVICDDKNEDLKWKIDINENAPRCASNIAKNKPAYQSGSPDSTDLLSIAQRGIFVQLFFGDFFIKIDMNVI